MALKHIVMYIYTYNIYIHTYIHPGGKKGSSRGSGAHVRLHATVSRHIVMYIYTYNVYIHTYIHTYTQVARRLLERLGCTCQTACNGLEALEIIKNNPTHFDIVFMDLRMPVCM
jgi:hypothetical protein